MPMSDPNFKIAYGVFRAFCCVPLLAVMTEFSACSDTEAPAPPLAVSQGSPQSGPDDSRALSGVMVTDCRGLLKDFDDGLVTSEVMGDGVSFRVSSMQPKELYDLPDWTLKLARHLYEKNACSWQKIDFEWEESNGQLVRFVLFRENFALYLQKKISRPEFERRLEVVRVDTLESIQVKLQMARKTAEHEKSLGLVDQWIALQPDSENALVTRGNVLLDLAQPMKAIEMYDRVLALRPDHWTARFNRAVAQKEMGSFAESIDAFSGLKESGSGTGETDAQKDMLLLHLTDAFLRNNEPDKAMQLLQTLPEQREPDVTLFRAEVLRLEKKFTEARDCLKESLKEGDDGLARFNLVVTYLDLHDEENAKLEFNKLKATHADLARELEFVPVFKQTETVAPVVAPDDTVEFLDED